MRLAFGLLAALVAAVAVAVAAAAAPVEVEVGGIGVDTTTGSPVVRLVEKRDADAGEEPRELPIWIGPFEAQAIALEMQGTRPPRPMTHDLMTELVERLGGRMDHVLIDELRGSTYYATIHVKGRDGRGHEVDARPSDAIALALRLRRPIRVATSLFTRIKPRGTPTTAQLWGLTLQNLTPELATFFEGSGDGGVLVSAVSRLAVARDALQGDVITALDDRPVSSVAELAERAADRVTDEPVRLSVSRGGRQLVLSFVAR